MTTKKRGRSMFDAVELLDSQDARAETKRHKVRQDTVARSHAAISQTKLYASLMECRILMQRSLMKPDKEPASTTPAIEQCNRLLMDLFEARRRLLVPSVDDTDYQALVQDDDNALERTLQQEYDTSRDEWRDVLNRRHKDVRLHAGLTNKAQFRLVDSSFWDQVEATVQHEEAYRDHQGVAFDDTKVYQHLLKDFCLTTQVGDVPASQRRLQQPKGNKKKVDRRASKGRKIRYTEISKLANFTFPLSRSSNTTGEANLLDQDEFFKSLFGGAGKKQL